MDPTKLTKSSCLLFTLLIFGLTSGNRKFRAITLLCVPFMASNRGKSILIFNCYELATTQILPNIERNLHSLQYFHECNQKLLSKETFDAASKTDMFTSLSEITQDFKKASAKTLRYLIRLKMDTKKTFKNIKKRQNRLFKNMRNRCFRYFKNIEDTCKQRIHFKVDSKIVRNHIIEKSCRGLDHSETCDAIGIRLKKARKQTKEAVDTFIDKKIDPLINDFKFDVISKNERTDEVDSDKSLAEVAEGIQDVYADRFTKMQIYIGKLGMITFPISYFLVIFGAVRYLQNYLTKDHYKNYVMGKLMLRSILIIIIYFANQ